MFSGILVFVFAFANDCSIVSVIVEQKSDVSTGKDILIAFESIEALDFLIEGSINSGR